MNAQQEFNLWLILFTLCYCGLTIGFGLCLTTPAARLQLALTKSFTTPQKLLKAEVSKTSA